MFPNILHGVRCNGLKINKETLTQKQLIFLREQLSYHKIDFMSQEQDDAIQFFTESETHLIVPKFFHCVQIPHTQYEFSTVRVPMATRCLNYKGELFETAERPQQTVFDRAVHSLTTSNTPGCVITLPCGTGKTNVAIAIALRLRSDVSDTGTKTAILCHTNFLLQQWRDRLNQYCSSLPQIGLIQKDVCDTDGKDFVLCSIQSIASRDYDPKRLQFGTLIVDEAHHIAAPVFARALMKMTYHYSIGLTATPTRRDGLEHIIYWHLGACCFNYRRPKNAQIAVKMITYPHGRQVEIRYKNGIIGIPRMINMIISDSVRNQHILRLVHEIHLLWPTRRGLLLSDRVSHLKYLHRSIGKQLSAVITGSYNSEISAAQRGRRKTGDTETVGDRKRTRDAEIKDSYLFKRFLTLSTYHLFSEAVDFTGDFIILATPRSRVEQAIGRVTRGHEGNHAALIIDIVDPYSLFENMKWMRYNLYKKLGYLVKFTATDNDTYASHDWLTKSPICITTALQNEHGIIRNDLVADDGEIMEEDEEEKQDNDQNKKERAGNTNPIDIVLPPRVTKPISATTIWKIKDDDNNNNNSNINITRKRARTQSDCLSQPGVHDRQEDDEDIDCHVVKQTFVTTQQQRKMVSYFHGLPPNRILRNPPCDEERDALATKKMKIIDNITLQQ
jgi:superfamily II DNA or RNA helicase